MAPTARKQSNGRSPLVNPQRQITAFFSKTTTPSLSPSPPVSNKEIPKSNPNPSPEPSSSPTTPSPLQSKPKKPLLVIGQAPSPSPSPSPSPCPSTSGYGKEVVDKRIKVYWPLDKSWYEGCVKSYDEDSKKHLVQYDDFEEELLDLGKEKIQWVEETVQKFKRLRRGSLGFRKMVIEDEQMESVENVEEDNVSCGGDGDDSSDEDWGKNVEKEVSEEEDVDLVDEEEEDDDKKRKGVGKSESKKRKASSGGGKLDSGKKGKTGGDVSNGGFKVSVVEPVKNTESK